MPLALRPTADGSLTLIDPTTGVTYHSVGGALGESRHVFIDASQLALRLSACAEVSIIEVGYGTGLNFALVAALVAELAARYPLVRVNYHAWEATLPPLELRRAVIAAGGFAEAVVDAAMSEDPTLTLANLTRYLHRSPWPPTQAPPAADAVFYDAFGPKAAPELWTEATLGPALNALKSGVEPPACLVTFSVTASVRRLAEGLGFRAERLPGFPPKREMLRIAR